MVYFISDSFEVDLFSSLCLFLLSLLLKLHCLLECHSFLHHLLPDDVSHPDDADPLEALVTIGTI